MSSSGDSVPVDAHSASSNPRDSQRSSAASSSVSTELSVPDERPAETSVAVVSSVVMEGQPDALAEPVLAVQTCAEGVAESEPAEPEAQAAVHTFHYAYAYQPEAVFADPEVADDATTTDPASPHTAEVDPYTYDSADVERAGSSERPEVTAEHTEAAAASEEASVRVRHVSLTEQHRSSERDPPSPSAMPAPLDELVRRRSFSSSPYVVTSPMMPLTTREANMLELLETALELTNVLSQTLHGIDRTSRRKPIATTTTTTPTQRSAGTTVVEEAGTDTHRHHCRACAPVEADTATTALCPYADSVHDTPNARPDAYVVAGRWEAQLRQPDPPRPRRGHSASGSRTGRPRSVHETPTEARPMVARSSGTFPFTSRAPARVPLNATSRFVLPKEARRPARQSRSRSAAAPMPTSNGTRAHSRPPPSTSSSSSPPVCPYHSPPQRGTVHRDPTTLAGTDQTSPGTCHGRHGRREEKCRPEGNGHPDRHHHHHGSRSRSGEPSHRHVPAPASSTPSNDPHALRRSQKPPRYTEPVVRASTAGTATSSSSVGSAFDYCLRQLREDYWSQSHQVLEQLESMLRQGE